MAASTAGLRVRDRIERICSADRDGRTLRLELLPEIRRLVGFDAYAWVLTDPETWVGSAPLADVPGVGELPRLIRLRYLTAVNRWTALPEPPVATLAHTTGGVLDRSLLRRELLAAHGVSDVASVVFADAYGCWAFLELWRRDGAVFDGAEAGALREIVPTVTTALRRSQARTFTTPLPQEAPAPGPLVLLLSPDLEVVRQTPDPHALLRLLVPRDDDRPAVPAGAYNVAAQLLAVEAGVDDHPPTARVHLAGGRWLTLRATRLEGDRPRDERDIAVTISESTPAERVSLFARACALSGRESEILGHLVAGHDTQQVATAMHLSAHTVQDHLKSVFAKAGTRGRRALLARIVGG